MSSAWGPPCCCPAHQPLRGGVHSVPAGLALGPLPSPLLALVSSLTQFSFPGSWRPPRQALAAHCSLGHGQSPESKLGSQEVERVTGKARHQCPQQQTKPHRGRRTDFLFWSVLRAAPPLGISTGHHDWHQVPSLRSGGSVTLQLPELFLHQQRERSVRSGA
jgi:hypothetical protein